MKGASFAKGVGEWIGAAEVYDNSGRFAGMGHDHRTVKADDNAGTVTVAVSFAGPFSLTGEYTVVDHGSYRRYLGPLNLGYAEAFADGLVVAHNYWPDLRLSQRFFLMVLPDGSTQLSLALLSRGEKLAWTVVGEYQRQTDPNAANPPGVPLLDPAEIGDDPNAGRGEVLLFRPGRWIGELQHCDANLQPTGEAAFLETVSFVSGALHETRNTQQQAINVQVSGLEFSADAQYELASDGTSVWCAADGLSGSATLYGGRALSGQFHHHGDGLRVWRREVACVDGTKKAVLHLWYQGEALLGGSYGVLDFEPEGTNRE